MKYLKIQNDGVLDIRLVALMGGTTKANDRFKIGQFGTGLKYTLSYLFRNNLSFKVFTGFNEVNITSEIESINETDFEIICINGNRTSITSFMGKEWSAWMIIRELWCNALDEGGAAKSVVSESETKGCEDKTTFFIQISPEIEEVLNNWEAYFIPERMMMWENEQCAIYLNERNDYLRVYKNGVLIFTHHSTKSLFNYDIKDAEINELREFRGMLSYEILKCLESPSEDVITYFLNNITDEHYEGCEMDYSWFTSFSGIWKNTIGNRSISKYGDRDYYSESGVTIDFTNVIELPEKVYAKLTKDFEGIGALAMSDDKTEFFEAPFLSLKEKVENAILLLIDCGYYLGAEVKVKYGVFRNNKKMCGSSKKQSHIMFSESAMTASEDKICAMIIQENESIKINVGIDSPQYAKHFIDLYTRTLLSKNQIEI